MAFKLQFNEFRKKLESGGGIECHGVVFASKNALLNWFEVKGAKIEVFLDAMAYLNAIRDQVVHQDDVVGKQR